MVLSVSLHLTVATLLLIWHFLDTLFDSHTRSVANSNIPFFCVTFLPFATRTKILTDQGSQTCHLIIVQRGEIPSSMIPTTGILCSEASGLRKASPMPISTIWWRSSAFLPIPSSYATITSSWLKGMRSPFNQGITSLSVMVGLFSAFLVGHSRA